MLTVILNPGSGTAAKTDPARLVELFRAEHLAVKIVLLDAEGSDRIIRSAAADPGDVLVAAGGDGTVSSVASVLAGGETPLGILPLGTLNHFSKDLGIPQNEAEAVKTIARRHVVRVDVGYVNDRAFINNSSIGLYPDIVAIRETLKRAGRNKWMALAAATAKVLQRDADVVARLDIDGRDTAARTPFLLVGNNQYTLEGPHLGRRTRLDGGRLYAYLAPRLHSRDLPLLLFRAFLHRAPKDGAFATYAASEIIVETPDRPNLSVALDGEVALLRTPLRYRAAPQALPVIVPA